MKYSALIGNPVDHSISPHMYGYFADNLKLEYSHIKIKVDNEHKLLQVLDSLRNLSFVGLNITLPYKINTLKYLDYIDDSVEATGAVNTIKIKDEKFYGYNTDAKGAIESIKLKLFEPTNNDNVLVFGSGGAAKAVIYELSKISKKVYIVSRNNNEASFFQERYKNVEILSYNNQEITKAVLDNQIKLFVNTTPVGMYPKSNENIMNEEIYSTLGVDYLSKCYFFDAVFNPYKTLFLKKAELHGAKVCSGLYWMIYQGLYSFSLWNNVKLSRDDIDEDDLVKFLMKKYEF